MTLTEAQAAAEQAEQEANEAAALAAELEHRLEAGDDTITAEQLDEQQRLSRFARLRANGAAKKRADAARARALEQAHEVIDRVSDIDTTDAELIEAWTAAVGAVRELAQAAVARTRTVSENANTLQLTDARLQRAGAGPIAALGVLGALFANEQGYRIPDRGLNVCDVEPRVIVATALEQGVRGLVDSGVMTLDRERGNTLAGSSLVHRIGGWDVAVRDSQANHG